MNFKVVLITAFIASLLWVTGFYSSLLTASYLGPTGRGDYFFVTTLALLLTQFAHLGLASSNTYLVSRCKDLFSPLLINSVWVSLVVGMLCAFILAIIINYTHVSFPDGICFLVLLVPASLFYLLGGNLIGRHR